ncbi:hypothetical protein BFP97_05555 [Roseivirga sp. 4D4]|uniref:DUF1801 domain-containing protein n=1 Tax=Roseivirga sp. 4D4 TaxID=1889784 RepID=UPI0008533101|nr:DUF1801 domain-containing protein [Roseivirga sp. 4D4]OEK01009.1 hypothetical protein BFP97_05555 [Roseivirga sp. 4D4]
MDEHVNAYIEKQQSPQREICYELRRIILEALPGVQEEMKWGVPSYDHGNYYIVALKTHVNIGFALKGLSKAERLLLKGKGKTMRHLEVFSLEKIEEKRVVKLILLVHERTQVSSTQNKQ